MAQIITNEDITTVLFDIDGTLANSFLLGFTASQRVLEDAGYPTISEEEYHAHCIYPTPERFARHAQLDGVSVGSPEFLRVGSELGQAFDDLYIDLVTTETAGFYPGIHELLHELHGRTGGGQGGQRVKLGALTNAAVAYAEAVLAANNVRHLFDSVHGADDVPRPKPHADGLLQCCVDLGVGPAQCVYVGDAPTDGKAAKATWGSAGESTGGARGMLSIGVSYGSHPAENLLPIFDAVVDSVDNLSVALNTLLPK